MPMLIRALLAVLLLAAPVHARPVPGKRLVGALLRNGVNIQFDTGRCSQPGVLGSYSRTHRKITLCPARMRSPRQLYQVLAHEAVHAAQHCAGVST
ncbi:MAG: hypothetical protein VKI63_04185, partial [Cyanobium sp.]|nr:hypothetical protein [Cyanobium sp.]